MKIVTITAFVMVACTAAAFAQDATPSAPAKKPESVQVDANRITCVKSDPPTGSRIGGHTTCHTQADWDTLHANSAEQMMDMQNHFTNMERGEHTGN